MNILLSSLRRVTASATGRFVLIVVAALMSILVVRGCRQTQLPVDVPVPPRSSPVDEQVRDRRDFKPPRAPQPAGSTSAPIAPVRAPIVLAASNSAAVSATGLVLPARRLIQCKLVNTVESSSLDTPIIALVTDDVFWRGDLLVPKGTEVHGRAQAHHLRDRVGSQGAWVLIWPDGEAVIVNGLALDLDRQEDHWGPSDGSAGLKGSREHAAGAEEVKLFAATFLAGLTAPFQERQDTILGFQVVPNVRNAALSGAGEVMESYAQRLLRMIEQESTFVRVPAGKAFYLYTLDPIQPQVTNALPSTPTQP